MLPVPFVGGSEGEGETKRLSNDIYNNESKRKGKRGKIQSGQDEAEEIEARHTDLLRACVRACTV